MKGLTLDEADLESACVALDALNLRSVVTDTNMDLSFATRVSVKLRSRFRLAAASSPSVRLAFLRPLIEHHPPHTPIERGPSISMPVPQLPVELIQLIVANPVLTKADLQSLSLTARAFPPLVHPHLFERLEIPLGWIPEDSAFPNPDDYGPAVTLDEMDRLMSVNAVLR